MILALVWRWAARELGPRIGLLATALTAAFPPILAHAGLATTDVPLVATFLWAAYTLSRYLDSPTIARAAILGCAVGFASCAKFSFLLFFPVAGVVIYAFRKRSSAPTRLLLLPLVMTVMIASAILVVLYRFQPSHFLDGIRNLEEHARRGHPSYVLGRTSADGFWYFFPVAVFFKTPLAVLILAIIGIEGQSFSRIGKSIRLYHVP